MIKLLFDTVVAAAAEPPESPTPLSERWTFERLMGRSPERNLELQSAVDAQHPGRWTLAEGDSEMGRGGSGVVLQSTDNRLGLVAIKFSQGEEVQKLEREVALMQRVAHPNVCRYFEHYQLRGGLFAVVLELVQKRSYNQRLNYPTDSTTISLMCWLALARCAVGWRLVSTASSSVS